MHARIEPREEFCARAGSQRLVQSSAALDDVTYCIWVAPKPTLLAEFQKTWGFSEKEPLVNSCFDMGPPRARNAVAQLERDGHGKSHRDMIVAQTGPTRHFLSVPSFTIRESWIVVRAQYEEVG